MKRVAITTNRATYVTDFPEDHPKLAVSRVRRSIKNEEALEVTLREVNGTVVYNQKPTCVSFNYDHVVTVETTLDD